MAEREDIEAYLLRAGLGFEEVDDGLWLVRDQGTGERIAVRLDHPLVVFRLKVLELAQVRRREELFQKLLELNAGEMVHGAYGISDGAVVLTCVLRAGHLDYEEFQGTIDDFSLAMTNHYPVLASYRDAA
ncbi:MAG TPA: hypothetical protein RMF84_01035 [Polyangiaceae bacterium LLY-WYZ-14_1]|jgi:hypothetical protein|nr:hypothetical protein [Polyangiaceae bacterium LLY-WYZ-14_1]